MKKRGKHDLKNFTKCNFTGSKKDKFNLGLFSVIGDLFHFNLEAQMYSETFSRYTLTGNLCY